MSRSVDNAKHEIPEETDYVHVIDLSNVLTVDRLHPVQTAGSLYRPVLPLLHRHRKLVSLSSLFLIVHSLSVSLSFCVSVLYPSFLPSLCLSLCPPVCLSVLLHPVHSILSSLSPLFVSVNSVLLSVYLSVRLSFCLSVCLSRYTLYRPRDHYTVLQFLKHSTFPFFSAFTCAIRSASFVFTIQKVLTVHSQCVHKAFTLRPLFVHRSLTVQSDSIIFRWITIQSYIYFVVVIFS